MAETQAKVYMKLRQANPSAAEKEILREMFVQRAKIALATGSKELFYQMATDRDWVDSVVKSNPDLLSMTIYIILCEHPELRNQDPRMETALLRAGLTQDDIFREVMKTVADALDKHAPSWRKHYAGEIDDQEANPAARREVKGAEAGAQAAVPLRFEAHEKRINSVLFFPDGARLISCGIDGSLKLWDTSARPIMELKTTGPIESIALSPDASLVACSVSNTVELWDLKNARKVGTYHGHKLEVYTVGFHPAGKHVFSADEDTIRAWDIGTGREVHRVTCGEDFFTAVAFSSDYRFVAVSGDSCTVRCLDLKSGEEWCSLAGHRSTVTSIAVARDGRFLLTGSLDMTSRLWDAQGRRETRRYTGFGRPIASVAFSPRSAVGLIAGDGLNVCLWDLNTGNPIELLTGQRAGVAAAAFSADGRHVVSGACDGGICLWTVPLGNEPAGWEVVKTQDGPGGQLKVPTRSSPRATPADAIRHYNEGVALINSGRREGALEKFDRALAQSPDFEEAWFNKGNVLHGMGRYEEAILSYDHAPSSFQAWCNKGQALRALGRYEAALGSYEHALRLKPDDKITWLNRGVALLKLKRDQEALVSFDRAIVLDQGYADAWVNKAGLLGQLKRYDEAYKCFDRGLSLNPSDFLGWYSKGNVLADQMRLSEAILCYEKALALNGNLDQAWVEKGLCLGKLERHDDSLKCFNMALTLNFQNRHAWLNRGVVMVVRFRDYRKGLICFQEAHRLGHPDAASMISTCRQKMDSGESF